MKHKITLAICLITVIALSIVCIRTYNDQNYRQHLIDLRNSAVQKINAEDVKIQQQKQQAEIDKLKTQCAKDHDAYLAETLSQRLAKTSVTDCNVNLQLVQ